jgi:hypothetical protein
MLFGQAVPFLPSDGTTAHDPARLQSTELPANAFDIPTDGAGDHAGMQRVAGKIEECREGGVQRGGSEQSFDQGLLRASAFSRRVEDVDRKECKQWAG